MPATKKPTKSGARKATREPRPKRTGAPAATARPPAARIPAPPAPRIPHDVQTVLDAAEKGEPRATLAALRALEPGTLGELLEALPWDADPGMRLAAVLSKSTLAEFREFARLIVKGSPPTPATFLKCCGDPACADECCELVKCFARWCRCCCCCWPPIKPPLCCSRCGIRVYPKDGAASSYICATSLRFAGATVTTGDNSRQAKITVPAGGGATQLQALADVTGAAPADKKLLVGGTDGKWHGDTHLVGTAADAGTFWTGDTIQAGLDDKADSSHTHSGYAALNHAHSEYALAAHTHAGYADVNHAHSEYAALNHAHSGYALTAHTHTGYADVNHAHSDYAALNHAHSEYALAAHTHAGYADVNHAHSGYAALNHAHSEYALAAHTHAGYADINHAHSEYALAAHTHTGFAAESHTHSEYALAAHSHAGYADINHTHSGYAALNHSHSEYALAGHTHTGFAADNHTHSEYAATNHTHSEYAATNHTHSEYAATSHTHSEYAATGHTHSGYAASSHGHGMGDLTGFAAATAAAGRLLVGNADGRWHGDTHVIGLAADAGTLWTGQTVQAGLDQKADSVTVGRMICAGRKQATFGTDVLAASPKLTVTIQNASFKVMTAADVVPTASAYVLTAASPPYAPLATAARAWVDAGQLKLDLWFDAGECTTYDGKVVEISYSLAKANDVP